ncbi:hypothetical protein CHUAL_000674 [Chamberlinius hualienensis]
MATPLRHIATEPANLNHRINSSCSSNTIMEPKNDLLKPKQQLNYRKSTGSQIQTSDSDLSVDTNSLSQDSQADKYVSNNNTKPTSSGSTSSTVKHHKDVKSDWLILEGLKDGQRYEQKPNKYEGNILKRRKWPLKGWHKRFCQVENGILKYSKTSSEMSKGRVHGQIDLGLSVISTRVRGRRMDIDAEDCIYHLKVKSADSFNEWVNNLRYHRLHRQHQIAFGQQQQQTQNCSTANNSPADDVGPLHLSPVHSIGNVRDGTPRTARSLSFLSRNRVVAWLVESAVLEKFDKELSSTQESIFHLNNLVEQLNDLDNSASQVNLSDQVSSSTVKRDRKRFVLKRKKTKGSSTDLSSLQSQPIDFSLSLSQYDHTLSPSSLNVRDMLSLSTSNPNLPTVTDVPQSSLYLRNQTAQIRQEFISTSQDALSHFRNLVRTIGSERDRLKQALELETVAVGNTGHNPRMAAQLNHALQQNAELRSTLGKIRMLTNICESRLTSPEHASQQQSYENSSAMSMSEYFDADDDVRNDSSSEVSASEDDEGSVTSENSETGTDSTPAQNNVDDKLMVTTGRRTCLPCPKPDVGDLNLWNLLRKNIGKDLSKIAMPVTINEPLNTLQRLCEELEYSELLDKANETEDFYERMVLVAAFAVSAYSSSYYRAGHKPFNPLLGETYECVREDKGLRFVAEQVCHHPPISVSYTESKNFVFWQDMRIKTTFWGKSMEVLPVGTVHLILPKFQEHYRWNKVTTCIHNLFGGQRWVDLYGELVINCALAKTKLTFCKASYWSSKRYEVYGSVYGIDGKVVHNLFGKWNEAIYCGSASSARCVWRIGALPEENERYYGFTRFAMELNELQPEMTPFLPPTDTRYRPDQRLLEEGNVEEAENTKVQLEQEQRERRTEREQQGREYEPMWFSRTVGADGKENWDYSGKYWERIVCALLKKKAINVYKF